MSVQTFLTFFPLPHGLQKYIVKKGRGSLRMHLKPFPSKWPKQTAFHSGARSGTSWRSPPSPPPAGPSAGREGQHGRLALDHSGLGTKHLSWGLLPAHLLPCPVAVDHCAGGPRSWQRAVKLFFLCSTPDSLQLFSCMSEGAQACWAGLISSASHLYISQKRHFCAIPL